MRRSREYREGWRHAAARIAYLIEKQAAGERLYTGRATKHARYQDAEIAREVGHSSFVDEDLPVDVELTLRGHGALALADREADGFTVVRDGNGVTQERRVRNVDTGGLT